MLVLISFTPILFAILVRGSYEESYNQIPLIYIGVFFSSISSFFGSIYIAKKATVEVGVSSIIAAVVNCVINFTLIKWIGLYAASISTIVAYLILALYRGFDINRRGYAKINYRKGHATACVILISISCVLCYQQKLVCNIVNAVIGIIGFIVLNRKMLVAVCSGIFKKFREGK